MFNTKLAFFLNKGLLLFRIFTLLGIIFVGLKLISALSFPWVWVLTPFWLEGIILIYPLATMPIGLFVVEERIIEEDADE